MPDDLRANRRGLLHHSREHDLHRHVGPLRKNLRVNYPWTFMVIVRKPVRNEDTREKDTAAVPDAESHTLWSKAFEQLEPLCARARPTPIREEGASHSRQALSDSQSCCA